MNMGIVNPSMLEIYDDIPKDLLERVEDVILNRRDDATERLLDFAESVVGKAKESKVDLSWREEPLQDRITRALVKGIDQYIICLLYTSDAADDLTRVDLGGRRLIKKKKKKKTIT